MSNFWDNMGMQNKTNSQFNVQQFLNFYKNMQRKDPNQILQNMLNSGQVTKDQIENAKSQANGIYQMLKTMNIL